MRYLLLFVLTVALVACDDSLTASDDELPGIPIGNGDNGDPCVFRDRTFDDDVTIQSGADCTFSNVDVEGNVQLERGARLDATDLFVDGNVQAQSADFLRVVDARIDGDEQCGGSEGERVSC